MFYCIVMLCLFAACNKNKDVIPGTPTPNPPASNAAITAEGAPTGPMVLKTIGTAGGTITSADGKITFTIPAGALDANKNITIQAIENKMPLGMKGRAYRFLPNGLQFKKPATLTLKYDDNDIAGSIPEQVSLASQTSKGSWKKNANIQLNTINKTINSEIHHFTDYAFYESFKLVDEKTGSDTAVIKVRPTEEVKLTVYYVKEVTLEDSLAISVPLLASGFIKEWTVNGFVTPPNMNFGGLGGKTGYTQAERDYIAPRRAPSPNSITVSVKLDLGSKGVLFILRNVQVADVNSLNLNGKVYPDATPSAIFLNNNTALNFGIGQLFPNGKSVSVGVDIQDIASPVSGIYSFAASEKVRIVAHDEFGNTWSSEKRDIHTGATTYSGNVEIWVSGSGNSRQLYIKITGMLFGASSTVNSAPVNTIMDVNAPVF